MIGVHCSLNRLVLVTVFAAGAVACTGELQGRANGGPTADGPAANTGNTGGSGMMGSDAGPNAGGNIGGSGMMSGGAGPVAPAATTRFARLTHRQWENAARDLLRLPSVPGLSATFTGDHAPGRFDNNGSTLQVTPQLELDYQGAAEVLADRVALDATALAQIAPASNIADATARGAAFIREFGRRAYRRPLEPAEAAAYDSLFTNGKVIYQSGDDFVDGVRLVLRAFLQSPHFLYRTELDVVASGATVTLSPYEAAAKLSLALTGTIPDDATLDAARDGRLAQPSNIKDLARSMLESPSEADLMTDFHAQVMRAKLYGAIDKDTTVFPAFVPSLGREMATELQMFSREVTIAQKGGLNQLLLSPFTFVNSRLAAVYGLKGTFSDTFQKAELNPTERAGLLTQLGFLAENAGRGTVGTGTIHRGVFIMRNLYCREISPPPNIDFANLPPGVGATNRERIDNLTSAPACAVCHQTFINPLGFALESFDALGRFRTTDENGIAIDSHGSISAGGSSVAFANAPELNARLAADPDVHKCYAAGWLEYLQGRLAAAADEPLLSDLAARSLADQLPTQSLVLELVTANSFLTRSQ